MIFGFLLSMYASLPPTPLKTTASQNESPYYPIDDFIVLDIAFIRAYQIGMLNISRPPVILDLAPGSARVVDIIHHSEMFPYQDPSIRQPAIFMLHLQQPVIFRIM